MKKIVYSSKYEIDLGGHVFITSKYRLIKERLIEDGIYSEGDFIEPGKAKDEDILLVHTSEYLSKVKDLRLSFEEIAKLEIPLSKEGVEASLIACQGSIIASEIAIEEKKGIHIGGGWHHAFPDHGEGFCVFNDIAIAIRKLQKEKKIEKAMVIDCDLHHGNGTAFIFADDPNVFTFSIHEADIYPFIKPKSSLDIDLPPFTKDEEYLKLLREHIPKIVQNHKPDIIIYQAGADPYEDDQLGYLKLTKKGLIERDKLILGVAMDNRVPIVLTLGGGYARNLYDSVDIHYNTIKVFSS